MRAFLLGASLLALSACGSSNDGDNTPDPSDPVDPMDPTDPQDPPTPAEMARDNGELASILAAHVRAEFPMQLMAADISEGRVPAGFSIGAQNADGSFTGSGSTGALTYAFTFHCNDGSTEHLVVPCDGNAHHSHIKFEVMGSQSMGSIAMNEINRVVDWEIRDLQVDKARFRGPDGLSLKTSVSTEGEAAQYGVQFTAAYEQVRYLAGYTFPTFGTIDFTINTERDRGADHRVFNSTGKLTFGGGGVPTTLVLDGNLTYTINLTTGDVVKL
jgi:hypothetical protein